VHVTLKELFWFTLLLLAFAKIPLPVVGFLLVTISVGVADLDPL
jgi:hypothetical protein